MTTRQLLLGFVASYAITGAVLALVLWLGRSRRLRSHLAAVATFLVGFGVVLFFAESLGRVLRFDPLAEGIHLPLAFLGAASLGGPLVTGARRWRGSGSLRAHRSAIAVFLMLFVVASATGAVMLWTGVPR